MPEIKVKIPDGDYCNGCPFLANEVKPIIDIMGNLKGIEEHHVCLRNNHSVLEEEMAPITPCGLFQDTKIKKDPFCKMGEGASKAFLLLLITALLMPKEGKDNAQTKRLPDRSNSQDA